MEFPAYIPVVTFDDKHPLDALVRPFLPRLAPAVMISYQYAKRNQVDSSLPVWIDSGGFAVLRKGAKLRTDRGLGVVEIDTDSGPELLHPVDVLEVQEAKADIAFSLDFPVPPGAPVDEARLKTELSIRNAIWALGNRRRKDLPLYASVPVTDDLDALRAVIRDLSSEGFDGIALGGLVPRARNVEFIKTAAEIARTAAEDLPLHAFGIGKPQLVKELFTLGVDSVDSSSYVRNAVEGKLWQGSEEITVEDPTPLERLHIALCNLANATGARFPISMAGVVFNTYSLERAKKTI